MNPQLMAKRFDPVSYNCAHFVCDAWLHITGVDLRQVLNGFLCAPSRRHAAVNQLRTVRFVMPTQRPSIVLMQAAKKEPHVGLWHRGRVLHLTRDGVQWVSLDVATLGFQRVRFFTC